MKNRAKKVGEAAKLLTLGGRFFTQKSTVLDLACGQGRNGLFLEKQGVTLSYLDENNQFLREVEKQCSDTSILMYADLEAHKGYDLGDETYDGILVFRYLYRPLFPYIKKALKPNGIIIYETFTEQQAAIGHPKNPDYLLQDNELLAQFSDYKIHYFYQGYDNEQQAYISQIIAEKI